MKSSNHFDAALQYVLYLPDELEEQKTWPLIVFLHGSGERGTDLNRVRLWGGCQKKLKMVMHSHLSSWFHNVQKT